MKILYIIEGLYNSGGMERVISMKANWLAENSSHEISILTFAQENAKTDYFTLSPNISRVNHFCKKNSDIKRYINKYLLLNPQDICISTYGREFKILPQLKDGSKKIVEFHFAYDINYQWLFLKYGRIVSTVVGYLKTWRMTLIAKKYDKIVVLTKADQQKWNSGKVIQIYNPHTISIDQQSDCNNKIVVAVGRMDYQKGFDYLLDCWKVVETHYPDWTLKIYGSGNCAPYIKQLKGLGLNKAIFMGASSDMPTAYCEGSIFVLSSRYEGFPLAVCEAMTCGLPIVSFDCPSGPSELIKNGVNGYLIPYVGDIQNMAHSLCSLIRNAEKRKSMGIESHNLSKKLEIDCIMNKWLILFQSIEN